MKVKNIVFSGFAAAILMGAVDANAAFSIASKDYVDAQTKITVGNEQVAIKDVVSGLTSGENSVDSKIEDVVGDLTDSENGLDGFAQGTDTVVEALNELKDDATAAATAAAGAKTAADNAQADVDALETKVGDTTGLETTFGSGNDTVVEELGALKTSVDSKADATDLTALEGRVSANETKIGTGTMSVAGTTQADIVAAINALDSKTNGIATAGNLETLEGSVNTLAETINGDPEDASDTGLVGDVATNTSAISTLQTAVGDASSGLTKGVADNAAAITALQTNAAVTSGITAEKVSAYDTKMTQLNGTCTSESDYCVLAKGQDGVMRWVEITLPFSVN